MLYALLATLLWASSSVASAQAGRLLGPVRTNALRLCLGVLVLGAYAHLLGGGLGPGGSISAGTWWFVLGGVLGLGLGDIAMFFTYRHLGARLGVLIIQTLAVPVAGLVEWLLRGTQVTWQEMLLAAWVLVGVAWALVPSGGHKASAPSHATRAFAKSDPHFRPLLAVGVGCGIFAGCMQGISSALSRHALQVDAAAGYVPDGGTMAYQRMLGGLGITLVWAMLWSALRPAPSPGLEPRATPWRAAWPWLLASALGGPILGLAAYQQALQTQPASLVQAVTVISPILVIPLAWWVEGDRPSWRSVCGGLVAIAAAAALSLIAVRS